MFIYTYIIYIFVFIWAVTTQTTISLSNISANKTNLLNWNATKKSIIHTTSRTKKYQNVKNMSMNKYTHLSLSLYILHMFFISPQHLTAMVIFRLGVAIAVSRTCRPNTWGPSNPELWKTRSKKPSSFDFSILKWKLQTRFELLLLTYNLEYLWYLLLFTCVLIMLKYTYVYLWFGCTYCI